MSYKNFAGNYWNRTVCSIAGYKLKEFMTNNLKKQTKTNAYISSLEQAGLGWIHVGLANEPGPG